MTRRPRTVTWTGVLGLAGVVSVAAAGWACVPMATVQASPAEVAAGQEVAVNGIRFIGFGPVTIRLHDLDGPVLATAPMGPASNTIFRTTVTVPPDTPPGRIVLVATQDPEPGGLVPWGVPARTVITVIGPGGSAPPVAPPEVIRRPAELSEESVSTPALVVAGLGVAAVALGLAGALALVVGRRRPAAAEVAR